MADLMELEQRLMRLKFSDNYLAKIINHSSINLFFSEINEQDRFELYSLPDEYKPSIKERTNVGDLIHLEISIPVEKMEYLKDGGKYFVVSYSFKDSDNNSIE